MKQAVLALPRSQLASLKDKKGNIDIEQVLEIPGVNVHDYPALYKARVHYLAITQLNNLPGDQTKTFSARLDRFCSLVKNAKIEHILTSSPAEKTLWNSLLNIIRAFRVSGAAGFFHTGKKMQAGMKLKEVINSLPKPKL